MENSLKFLVEDNPDQSYRFYKYLLEGHMPSDVTVAPKALNYNITVDPKMGKNIETVDPQGSLVYANWWAYDSRGTVPVEEVLKVDIEYTYADDAEFNTAKTVLSRQVRRQWILENGTYKIWTPEEIESGESDIKLTDKVYGTYRARREVGQRGRANVQAIGEEKFIKLVTLLITGGNQQLAETLGKSVLRKYSAEYNEFWSVGDGSFMQAVLDENDTTDLLDKRGDPIILGISANSLLSAVVPAAPFTINIGYGPMTFNQIVPGSEGLSIRQFLYEKYRGNI